MTGSQTHRVNSSQQQLSDAGVDLGFGHLVAGQQVGQVEPLRRLAIPHLSRKFGDSPLDQALGCRRNIECRQIYGSDR